MWTAQTKEIENGSWISIQNNMLPISYDEIIDLWQSDSEFREYFSELLAGSHYEAFRWETPPITTTNIKKPFECVLLNSPYLARKPDKSAFGEHIENAETGSVIQFQNLGKDARMIVPCPADSSSNYSHLGIFLRSAPAPQRQALWQKVGEIMSMELGSEPKWLSTAGAGVAWLHIRIDSRPKYYGYQKYRDNY